MMDHDREDTGLPDVDVDMTSPLVTNTTIRFDMSRGRLLSRETVSKVTMNLMGKELTTETKLSIKNVE